MDVEVVRWLSQHRWGPLTEVMRLASAWWFKSLLMIGLGLVAELRVRRPPWGAALAAAAYGLASVVSDALKELIRRPRPPVGDAAITVVGRLPESFAMPSTHAAGAGAVATVLAIAHPRLRATVVALALMVAASRVYLGVHHPTDVLAGLAVGALAGWVVHAAAGGLLRLWHAGGA